MPRALPLLQLMGCGVSKFDQEEVGRTCVFIPNRRRTLPITRQLPKEGRDHEDHDSLANNGRKSVSSPAKDVGFVKLSVMQEANERERGAEKKEGPRKVMAAKVRAEEKCRDKGEGVEDGGIGEDQKNEFSHRENSILRPGSPSFREYIAKDLNGTAKNHDYGNDDGTKRKNKTLEDDIAPRDSEESGNQLVNKGSKRRGITSSSARVKNLLNVTTCYNPNHPTSYNPLQKLGGKAA